MLVKNGWLGQQILRTRKVTKVQSAAELFKKGWQILKNIFAPVSPAGLSFTPAVPPSRSTLQYAPVMAPLKPDPAAALAFLIAGPTTTLPAMAAVWPLVTRRVFVLYVSFSLLGAALTGYFFRLVAIWF
jgi:hypothetical protein